MFEKANTEHKNSYFISMRLHRKGKGGYLSVNTLKLSMIHHVYLHRREAVECEIVKSLPIIQLTY